MPSTVLSMPVEAHAMETQYQKGVKHLSESGIPKVPKRYVWPISDRPIVDKGNDQKLKANPKIQLPIIDLSLLQSPRRLETLQLLSKACEEYGFFQVVNHGIPSDIVHEMMDKSQSFFELPFEERSKYMSSDMSAPVRYGTSFNQNKDRVFCWRDFLKLNFQPSEVPSNWPSSPAGFSENAVAYAKGARSLFVTLVKAVLESLGLEEEEEGLIREFEEGSQLVVINCYPSCPEPDLTLGMPPHSDYGFLTLLLNDGVHGLQIESGGKWVTVEPLPGALVINVGDHLEIFSNGKYKSVVHRVVASTKPRISVASLHSLPFDAIIGPAAGLITAVNPRRYKDTDFAAFLSYAASTNEHKAKSFLGSIKIPTS